MYPHNTIPEGGIEDEEVGGLDDAARPLLFLTSHLRGCPGSNALEHFELAAGERVEHSFKGLYQRRKQ